LQAIAVFDYLQQLDVNSVFWDTYVLIREQLAIVESKTDGAPNLAYKWDEYFHALTNQVARLTRQYLFEQITLAEH
jgi:hypothetical protein